MRHSRWIAAGLYALVLASGMGCGSNVASVRQTEDGGATKSVATMTINEQLVPEWLEATGSVRSKYEATLASKVMARVVEVTVREGDRVRKGQVLVRLEESDLAAAEELAKAGLQAAMVQYGNSRTVAAMERSMSEARLAQALSALQQAEAGLMVAKARLDLAKAGPRRQERMQAELAVRQAETQYELAQTEFRRIETLHKEGAVAQRQFDAAKTQLDVARAQLGTAREALSIAQEGTRVEDLRAAEQAYRQAEATVAAARAAVLQARAGLLQAKVREEEIRAAHAQVGQSAASVRLARTNRSYTKIVAPFDGVVTTRFVDPGSMAATGAPLLTVVGGPTRLEAVVPEANIARIRLGMPVSVDLDALLKSIDGRVAEIRPYGDATTHTFLVRVELPEGTAAKPGMYGRARFEIGVRKQILVPKTAVWTKDGMHCVYAVTEGRAVMRIVMPGEEYGPNLRVLSGLEPGDVIVANHADVDREGQRVAAR
ncbi:MAG: efflux RND transporter periplasmic adaptor subunit [Fimbriimonadales bacterium]|nr:efflux RND transporter periplasmic adaptor subunit [Fimbriimonadales bacterium]